MDTVADEAWLEETGTTVAELVMEEPGMNYQLAVGRTAETKPEDYNIIVVDSVRALLDSFCELARD